MNSILTIWFLFFLNSELQSSCHQVCWKNGKELNWELFLGEPNNYTTLYGDSVQAVSNLTIVVGLDSNNYYTVKAVFNKSLSWYLKRDDLLLRHEQGHFDLTEVYARLLRNRIEINEDDENFDINLIYKRTIMELDSISERYDVETLHGSIFVQQEKWDIFIKDKLNELSKYSDETTFCPCD